MANRYAVASGNWSNAATWDGGTLPQSGDTVRPNGYNVTVDQDFEVTEIRNDASSPAVSGGYFIIAAGVTLTANLTGKTGTLVYATGANCIIVGECSGAGGNAVYTNTTCTIVGNCSGNGSDCITFGVGTNLHIIGDVIGGTSRVLYTIGGIVGTITITGDVYGRTIGGDPTIDNRAGHVVVNGNCYARSTAAVVTGNGSTIVNGNAYASANAPAIVNGSSVPLRISGDGISFGTMPPWIAYIVYLGTGELHYQYAQDGGGVRDLYTGGIEAGHPSESDVRFGTAFGASDEYTGTLRVPDPAYVSAGVLTDDTVGTQDLSSELASIKQLAQHIAVNTQRQ